ncbi:MAG: hydrogenase maturation protease, partial [Planctomycetota bacterium]
MKGALVLGVGAPVGDDAVGLEVVRELVRRGLPAGVEAREVVEPSQLVTLIVEAERVVIVDAVLDGSPPGTVTRIPLDALASVRSLSTHGVSVFDALELARVLAPRERRIDVIGVTIAGAR